MKITVDTKEDSVDELKNLIRMLSALVNERGGDFGSSQAFQSGESSEQAANQGLFDMFGSPGASTKEQQELGRSGDAANDQGAVDVDSFLSSEEDGEHDGDAASRVVTY